MPAAQILVAAWIRRVSPSGVVISTPSSSMSLTIVPRWISTPMRVSLCSVRRETRAPIEPRRWSVPSTRTTRASCGLMRR